MRRKIINSTEILSDERELQIFNNEEFGEVRTIVIDNEPWFVLIDLCKALNIKNTTQMASRLDEDEWAMFNIGCQGNANIVNESGLYKVIFRSDKPEAKAFTKWVTSEILPAIRKHGMYTTDELLDNPDLLIQVATKLKEEREKNNLLVLENKKKIERIEHLEPHADFSKEFLKSEGAMDINALSKNLQKIGVPMGRNQLFVYLRDNGYIVKSGDFNIPSQKSIKLGIMVNEEYTFHDKSGSIRNARLAKITPKGTAYFYKKLSQKKIVSA